MSLGATVGLLRCYIIWILFLAIRYTFAAIQICVWRWNGTYRQLKRCQLTDNYLLSAHKMKILCNYRLDPFMQIHMRDYVLMHHSFLAPEYVLRDDVHLMQVTANDAIFVQLAKGAKGPHCYPFATYGYTTSAENIIVMPLKSLHRLAKGMGENDSKLVCIHNQGRCGGTLLTEIFKATERCVTFGEPHPLTRACSLYVQRKWTRPFMMETLKGILKLQCKPQTEFRDQTLAYVIKPNTTVIHIADMLREAFPDIIQLFIYRDPVTVAVSTRKACESIPSFAALYRLSKIPGICVFHLRFTGYPEWIYSGWNHEVSLDIECGYRLAAICMKEYNNKREQGTTLHGVRYEILLENQQMMVEKIFEICGLPTSLIPNALEAFSRDSQDETHFNWKNLAKVMPIPPKSTPAILEALKRMSKDLGVPGPDGWDDKEYVLPGTIKP